jgi:DNA-binding NarL/FixJ family response regulator
MNRTLVADDHPLFRAALRQAAAAAVPDAELSEAADLEGLLAALSATPDTDVRNRTQAGVLLRSLDLGDTGP